MEDKFPISNVSFLFTQYRTQVLEETGRVWFYPDYNPDFASESPVEESGEPQGRVEELSASGVETVVAEPTVLQEPVVAHAYDHPDPWDMPDSAIEKDETIQSSKQPGRSETPGIEVDPPPLSEKELDSQPLEQDATVIEVPVDRNDISVDLEADKGQPLAQEILEVNDSDALTDEAEAANDSARVNLFPFESQAVESAYDLTEFDNGEIEVPPVAVRDRKTASFEKLKMSDPSQNSTNPDVESAETSTGNGGKKKKKNNTASSADIAKYRLRNLM